MPAQPFEWNLAGSFVNRSDELSRLEQWWGGSSKQPLALIGRRRVGKSWLFRRFAHGKPAVILVAEQLPAGTQLTRFADQLEPLLGVRPDLPDVPSLFRVVFRAARREKLLVVIDEFPWLLGTSWAETHRTLTAIQAVMEEERDRSRVRLIVCGSHVSSMESLFSEQNPMHGRLERFEVRPLSFGSALPFMPSLKPIEAFERYSVAGGMPLYLDRLAQGSIRHVVTSNILDRHGPLWNEGRAVLEQELREPRVYFGILEQLAGGDKELNAIANPLRMDGGAVAKYLTTLVDLRIVARKVPFGAPPNARTGHWRLDEPFLRFWFRFVFPFQSDLETGLAAGHLYDGEVVPAFAEHVSPVFEAWCRSWLRAHRGDVATRIGAWWGNALDGLRRTGERSTEEIDAVGTLRQRVSLVAEAKWTNRLLGPGVLKELEEYKLPALEQAGFRIDPGRKIVLFSKSGYSEQLHEAARVDSRIELVDVAEALESVRES